jgi:hypothetical protein
MSCFYPDWSESVYAVSDMLLPKERAPLNIGIKKVNSATYTFLVTLAVRVENLILHPISTTLPINSHRRRAKPS